MVAIFKSRFFFRFQTLLRRGVPLFLIAASAPAQSAGDSTPAGEIARIDSRVERLAQFFRARKSPLDKFAEHFVRAADRNKLDWRLLPSLAMLESGGGRVYIRNNVFGWASGRARFQSIEAGIDHVAQALSEGIAYRNKDLRAKLRTYNPANRRYVEIVFGVFREISPEAPMLAPPVLAGGGK